MLRNKVKQLVLSLTLGLGIYGCASAPGPENFDAEQAAKTRVSLGLTYLRNGNYTQAKLNLDKAIQYAPRMAQAHHGLAYYYQQVGEFALAEDAYQQAMAQDRYNPEIANSYGAFLCEQGKYDQAKVYFLSAIKNETYVNTAASYENLALCSYSQGQYQDAVEYLTSALNHQPSRTKSLGLMTEWLLEQGNYAKAKNFFQRYERIGRVSPAMLWLGARVEAAMGNRTGMASYGDMLINLYPEHTHTQDFAALAMEHAEKPQPTALEAVEPEIRKVQKRVLKPANPPISVADSGVSTDTATATGPKVHVVQQDENLYRISLLHNVRLDRLIEWNELTDASQIYTGMELFIEDPSTMNQSSN